MIDRILTILGIAVIAIVFGVYVAYIVAAEDTYADNIGVEYVR